MGDAKPDSKDPQPEQPFQLPKHLLNQISEYTVGGFVLFYFNPLTGYPQQIMTFDSPAHCLAMQKHIGDWSLALQNIYIDGNERNIKRVIEEQGDSPEQE